MDPKLIEGYQVATRAATICSGRRGRALRHSCFDAGDRYHEEALLIGLSRLRHGGMLGLTGKSVDERCGFVEKTYQGGLTWDFLKHSVASEL